MKNIIYILLVLCGVNRAVAQTDDDPIATFVHLEAFEVSAGLDDFDVEDFIRQVQTDTTFYQAFLNLKYFPHYIESEMSVYDKDSDELAWLKREAQQYRDSLNYKWVEIAEESSNGKLWKKNGEWKYLTAEMYDEVFFDTRKEKVSNRMGDRDQKLDHDSKMEKHKAQLKKMLFNPGEEIKNVPFIGDKMAIFSEEMVPHYEYRIFSYKWQDSIPCIGFSCVVKEGHEDDVVIRDLTSYFDEESMVVLARDYQLAYNTLLFDFDIVMKVENAMMGEHVVPISIQYNGYWDVPFRKPEIITFSLKNSEYRP